MSSRYIKIQRSDAFRECMVPLSDFLPPHVWKVTLRLWVHGQTLVVRHRIGEIIFTFPVENYAAFFLFSCYAGVFR